MKVPQFQSRTTKIAAFRLIHDPTRLFSLLFSKYGDIEEEIYLYYSNQLVYNEYTHFNTIFKENKYISDDEFIKRLYNINEVKNRISKLNDYYSNYLKFFSKPIFVNTFFNKLVNKYYDNKAEIFYVNNLSKKQNSQMVKRNKKQNNIDNASNLSSIDNDTENDIIFNKRIKKMIDNNLNNNSCTITLDINTKNDLNYINNKNISDSFTKLVSNFVNYQINSKDKPILKSNKMEEVNKNNLINELNIKENEKNKDNYKENNKNKNIELAKNELLLDLKSHDKEKNFEPINKYNFHNNNKKIKFFLNDKNIIEKNKLGKVQELGNIKLNNQKNLSPLIIKEQNILDNKIFSKKIFYKKNASFGFNLNLYKIPSNKIHYINFYSPQNNLEKRNIFNKLVTPINYRNNSNNKNSSLSEILINPGFLLNNIDNSAKKISNKKYKLFSKNLKDNIQKIKTIIHSKQNNFNNLNIKSFKIKSLRNKRNKSQNIKNAKNITLKDSIFNLSREKKLSNNSNEALNSIVVKKNNSNFINKGKALINNDTYQYLEIKNNLSNFLENNLSKNHPKNGNKLNYEDSNKIGGNNNNLIGKKIFSPINFKKCFNKKDIIKEKNFKFGLNLI